MNFKPLRIRCRNRIMTPHSRTGSLRPMVDFILIHIRYKCNVFRNNGLCDLGDCSRNVVHLLSLLCVCNMCSEMLMSL